MSSINADALANMLSLYIQTASAHERSVVEQLLAQQRDTNLRHMCVELVKVVEDEALHLEVRLAAGQMLNKTLSDGGQSWRNKLDDAARSQLRSSTLSTTLSTSATQPLRTNAARLVAALALMDWPAGEWLDLVGVLHNAGGSAEHAEQALIAITCISDAAAKHEDVVGDVLRQHAARLVDAIFTCLSRDSTNTTVMVAGSTALASTLPFMDAQMESPTTQGRVVELLCQLVQSNESKIRLNSMRCFTTIADLYYPILSRFKTKIPSIIVAVIQSISEEECIKVEALLFWLAVAEKEKELIEGGKADHGNLFIAQGLPGLVNMCLDCMQQQDPDQLEEDCTEEANTVAAVGSKLLLTIAEIGNEPVIGLVLPFISKNINSPEWRKREAAISAFGCILSCDVSNDLVAGIAPVILNKMLDEDRLVASSAGWVTSDICEKYPAVYATSKAFDSLISTIGPMINGSSAIMSIRASMVILAASLKTDEDSDDMPTDKFSKHFQTLCNELLGRIHSDGSDVSVYGKERVHAGEALSALIGVAALDCIGMVESLIPTIVLEFKSIIDQQKQAPEEPVLLQLLGIMCATLSTIARKGVNGFAPRVNFIMYALNVEFCTNEPSVLEEQISLLGSLSHAAGPAFSHHAQQTIGTVLNCALTFKNTDLSRVAVGVITDFANSLGPEGFAPMLHEVASFILSSLVDVNANPAQRIGLFECAGDLALNLGMHFSSHVPVIVAIAQAAFAESLETLKSVNHDDDDNDAEQQVLSLWRVLCQLYTSILQGQRDSTGIDVSQMVALANHVCLTAQEGPETFAASLALIGDIADVCNDDAANIVGPVLLSDSISACLSKAAKSDDEEVRRNGEHASMHINALAQKRQKRRGM